MTQHAVKGNNRVTFPIRMQTPIGAMYYEKEEPMKTTNAYIKIGLLLLAAVMFTAPKVFGDTYSWTNFQSDIPGVAQHVDPNLVNPWGMCIIKKQWNHVRQTKLSPNRPHDAESLPKLALPKFANWILCSLPHSRL